MPSKNTYISCNSMMSEGDVKNDVVFLTPCVAGEHMCISHNIDHGVFFFYSLDRKDVSGCRYKSEVGLGHIEKKGKRSILVRDRPIMFMTPEGHSHAAKGHMRLTDGNKVLVQTRIPKELSELSLFANTVFVTGDNSSPILVEVEENSVLGRKDGALESLDRDEIAQILGTDFLDNHLAKTKNISADIMSVKQILISPVKTKPRNRDIGSIIYNEKKSRLEMWDGKKWRGIAFED